jgi:hypothetical protein
MIRKPHAPLQQVVRRLSEQKGAFETQEEQVFRKGLNDGPLPTVFSLTQRQFKEFHSVHFKLSVSNKRDNCFLINGKVALAHNFVEANETKHVIYQTFEDCNPFFTYPTSPSNFHIFSVSQPNHCLEVTLVSAIDSKCVLLSKDGTTVAIPFLHTLQNQ